MGFRFGSLFKQLAPLAASFIPGVGPFIGPGLSLISTVSQKRNKISAGGPLMQEQTGAYRPSIARLVRDYEPPEEEFMEEEFFDEEF